MVLKGDGEWTLVEKKRIKTKTGPRFLGKSSVCAEPSKSPEQLSTAPPKTVKDHDSVAAGNHFDILNGE
jgi:hypothetical protein